MSDLILSFLISIAILTSFVLWECSCYVFQLRERSVSSPKTADTAQAPVETLSRLGKAV